MCDYTFGKNQYYFSDEEWKTIIHKSELAKLNTTEFIIRSALTSYTVYRDNSIIKDLIFELNKIGNNVNQIVKKINTLSKIVTQREKQINKKIFSEKEKEQN